MNQKASQSRGPWEMRIDLVGTPCFDSDMPPDPKANLVSVVGRERNGVFVS